MLLILISNNFFKKKVGVNRYQPSQIFITIWDLNLVHQMNQNIFNKLISNLMAN